MSIYKHAVNGAWVCSDIIHGHLITRTYYGYTKRQAMAMFKAEEY